MKTSYNFVTTYPNNLEPISVRALMNSYLIPKKWQHFLRINEAIKINGKYQSMNSLVEPGSHVDLTFTEEMSSQHQYLLSGRLPQIIYEDKYVLVINKPAGQKSHPNLLTETNTALNDVATYLKQTNEVPYVTHRLDMLTSGLLLVAKNPVVVPLLNRQLVNKTMKRDYLAEVTLKNNATDITIEATGTITKKIGRDPSDKRKRIISNTGLAATTHYEVLSLNADAETALVKLSLETGRTHQLRIHLASCGLPIIGDPLYNHDVLDSDKSGLKLQAYQMRFMEPFNYQIIEVQLPNNQWLSI